MKIICPISGVPFRTYDSLTLSLAVEHPIFTVPFEQIILLLDPIREQEEAQLRNLGQNFNVTEYNATIEASIKDLTNTAVEAIHEKNWRNPVFKLYQTKQLVMLALMKLADLLENERGYVAKPAPSIIDAYFWNASELFIWANTIRNPNMLGSLPKYRISKHNENLDNFPEYLQILQETKDSIGARYRAYSEENKLRTMERALAILSKRREAYKVELTSGRNTIAARWALTITRCPKDIFPFWYAILSSTSIKILFDGVKVEDTWQSVTAGDLRELRDYLEDNLIGPRGENKQTHIDDSEYYFMARQMVLNIIRKHIAILEQGTSSYKIVNAALGADILNANDDSLEKKGLVVGLDPKPTFADYKTKIDFIQAMAKWRHETKTKLLEISNKVPSATKESRSSYEIL